MSMHTQHQHIFLWQYLNGIFVTQHQHTYVSALALWSHYIISVRACLWFRLPSAWYLSILLRCQYYIVYAVLYNHLHNCRFSNEIFLKYTNALRCLNMIRPSIRVHAYYGGITLICMCLRCTLKVQWLTCDYARMLTLYKVH